ncbi:MAG: ribosome-associated translation inhibitor RaiA [Actinobacteria bacterium]|jgi:putative sigma-54 modulation protein|nr:ribosome-associated translation inhibitor RaiA [Actinomycetota bacterium]
MDYILKSRNVELNDEIKEYVEKKIKARVEKFDDKIIKIEIEFSLEKNPSINLNNKIVVTIFTPRAVIRATDYGVDFFEAIDRVNNKIERQVKKYKNKIIQKVRKVPEVKIDGEELEENLEDLKTIVKTKKFEIKPMTPDEASLQMELIGHAFYVFVNAETGKTAVLYKRKDENYGLIEPQH